MTFTGFTQHDFDTFTIDGLEPRMAAIRERLQPKFRELGESLRQELALLTGSDMHLHIAKHLRRTTNPPKDTWLAVCANKRGYKMVPHFQVGLFDDHLFIWFALIYELPGKKAIAQAFLREMDKLRGIIPSEYRISLDHTRKDSFVAGSLDDEGWLAALTRFRDVQKAELLVGRHVAANEPLASDGAALTVYAADTIRTLLPLYELACSIDPAISLPS